MALCTVRQQHKTALRLNYNCFSQNNFFGKKPASAVKAVFALAQWEYDYHNKAVLVISYNAYCQGIFVGKHASNSKQSFICFSTFGTLTAIITMP